MNAHSIGFHDSQSDVLIMEVSGGAIFTWMTPSEVEQKLLCPVLVETGVATAT